MNQEMWSKSLLASYTILPKIAKCIDKSNMTVALSGFSYAGNTWDLMKKIVNNNSRKEGLANVKVIVDETLASLKPKHRQILEMKYIQLMDFEKIGENLGICVRTVFRRYTMAIKSFASSLTAKGYTTQWLESQYAKDPLFVRLNEKSLAQLQKNQYAKEKPQKAKALAIVVASVFENAGSEMQSTI